MNRGNASVPIDHKRRRQRFQTAVLIARLVIAQHDAIVDLSFCDERIDRLPAIVVHRDAEDFEAAVLVFALELREPGDLDHARAAPRCPEIEQHHFALIVGEVNQLAVRILQSEIGRVFALAVILDDRAAAVWWASRPPNRESRPQTRWPPNANAISSFSLIIDYIGNRWSRKCASNQARRARRRACAERDFGIDIARDPRGGVAEALTAVFTPAARALLRHRAADNFSSCAIPPTSLLRRVHRNSIRFSDAPPTPGGAGSRGAPTRSENTREAVSCDAPEGVFFRSGSRTIRRRRMNVAA